MSLNLKFEHKKTKSKYNVNFPFNSESRRKLAERQGNFTDYDFHKETFSNFFLRFGHRDERV